MALYALGDSVPQTPGEGEYWVAPDARHAPATWYISST